MDTIRIKCPVCGVILEARDDPANAEKSITCPNCKQKNRFKDFKQIASRPSKADTNAGETQIERRKDSYPGCLIDRKTSKIYTLTEGSFVVGRRSLHSVSKADIALETDDMGISREHMRVDVMSGRDGRYHVYISNANNQNPTYINGELLSGGDKLGLSHGDLISISDTVLVYMGNPVDDKTEL